MNSRLHFCSFHIIGYLKPKNIVMFFRNTLWSKILLYILAAIHPSQNRPAQLNCKYLLMSLERVPPAQLAFIFPSHPNIPDLLWILIIINKRLHLKHLLPTPAPATIILIFNNCDYLAWSWASILSFLLWWSQFLSSTYWVSQNKVYLMHAIL